MWNLGRTHHLRTGGCTKAARKHSPRQIPPTPSKSLTQVTQRHGYESVLSLVALEPGRDDKQHLCELPPFLSTRPLGQTPHHGDKVVEVWG